MVEECTYDRIPQEQAAEIVDNVIQFRKNYDQYEKPDDVNALMRLFPSVQLREGYILDYEQVHEGEVVTRIRPFARKGMVRKKTNRCCSILCRRKSKGSPIRTLRRSINS